MTGGVAGRSQVGTGGTVANGGSGGATSGATGGAVGTGGAEGPDGGVAFSCPSGPFTGTIPDGSKATRIANAPLEDDFNSAGVDFTNCEGPVWIGDALYFSELKGSPNPPPSRILKIDASDNVTIAFPSITDTGTNGLALNAQGNIVGASHGLGGIVEFALPGGAMTTLVATYNGKRFNSPNDLTIAADGTIYFTDPNFQASFPLSQSSTGVYRLPAGSATAEALITTLSNPNGATLSLDQKTLYVSHGSGVYKYAVAANGSIDGSNPVHVDPGDLDGNSGDGMVMDCAGNLYVVRASQHDIIVVGSSNAKIGQIVVPGAGQLTNVAFGGSDHKTLYITAQAASASAGGTGRGSGGQAGSVAGDGGVVPNQGRGVFKLTDMPFPGMPY